jgi:hypothetical protein
VNAVNSSALEEGGREIIIIIIKEGLEKITKKKQKGNPICMGGNVEKTLTD